MGRAGPHLRSSSATRPVSLATVRLKLLFVLAGLHANGAARVAVEVIRHLDRRRFAPSLFVLDPVNDAWGDVPDDVPVRRGPARDGSTARWRAMSAWSLVRAAWGADVIIGACEWSATRAAEVAGWVTRKPVIGWVHAQLDHHLDDARERRRQGARYRRLAHVVACSDAAAASMGRLGGIRPGRLTVIPNPIDLARLEVLAAAPLAFPDPRPTLVAVGRVVPAKGLDRLISAHAALVRRHPHRLLVLGEGASRAALQSQASALGVADSVALPGFVRNPFPEVRAARGLVLPSHSEGLSMVVLEALALGTPVVATRCGAEQLLEPDAGLVVPLDDDAALVQAMERILVDDALVAALAARGRERASEYRFDRLVPRWEALLESIARR